MQNFKRAHPKRQFLLKRRNAQSHGPKIAKTIKVARLHGDQKGCVFLLLIA